MNIRILLPAFLAIAIAAAAAAQTSSPPPTPAASTHPAAAPVTMFAIHGHLKLAPGLELQKPVLTRAVVFLGSSPVLDAVAIPKEPAIVGQKNKTFIPNFIVIPKGLNVEFPNWDNILHNVFSRSAAAPAFDLDRYPYGQSKTRTFDKTGVIQLFCNIHPDMKALIYVAPNTFFARAQADGQFEIPNVPAGHFDLSVWQERCAAQQQAIDVGPTMTADVVFTLAEDRGSILANDPPRHGEDYGVARGLGVKREKLDLPIVGGVHPATAAPTTAPCPNCP